MKISQKIVSLEQDEALIAVCIDEVKADSSISPDQLPRCGTQSLMRMDRLGAVRWVDGQAAWQGAEHSMMKFPQDALSPGSKWVQPVEDATGSATPFYTLYEFKGLNRKNRRLAEFHTELHTGHPDSQDSRQTGKGRFLFDLNDNWIDSCDNFIEYQFEMPVPENPAVKIITETTLKIEMERIS
jgi:hypothetical protein